MARQDGHYLLVWEEVPGSFPAPWTRACASGAPSSARVPQGGARLPLRSRVHRIPVAPRPAWFAAGGLQGLLAGVLLGQGALAVGPLVCLFGALLSVGVVALHFRFGRGGGPRFSPRGLRTTSRQLPRAEARRHGTLLLGRSADDPP
eukprot:14402854-Alexandrium_andersonii.AAC.1